MCLAPTYSYAIKERERFVFYLDPLGKKFHKKSIFESFCEHLYPLTFFPPRHFSQTFEPFCRDTAHLETRYTPQTHRLIPPLEHIFPVKRGAIPRPGRCFPPFISNWFQRERERERITTVKGGRAHFPLINSRRNNQLSSAEEAKFGQIGERERERIIVYFWLFISRHLCDTRSRHKLRGVRRFLCILRRILSPRHLFTLPRSRSP